MNAVGYPNLGAAKRAHRQLQRAWSVSGRRQYGVKSIIGYLHYMGYGNEILDHAGSKQLPVER